MPLIGETTAKVRAGIAIGAVVTALTATLAGALHVPPPKINDFGLHASRVQLAFLNGMDTLFAATAALQNAAAQLPNDAAHSARTRQAFARARVAYKRIEYLLEYATPISAHDVNGPPIPQANLEEGPDAVIPPAGFQVVEGLLFPATDAGRSSQLQTEVAMLHEHVARAREAARQLPLTDMAIFDAMRVEIARIAVLGVTGFDSPVRRASLAEARVALDGMRTDLKVYDAALRTLAPAVSDSLTKVFARSFVMLDAGRFATFDRLAFIVRVINPLAHALADARKALSVPVPTDERMWRTSSQSIFDADAFDVDAVRPLWGARSTPARVALGNRLFFDTTLTGSSARSCATCHQPQHAFTDGLATSARLGPGTRLRNAPTLINAGLQSAQFTDMRAPFLEDQISIVLHSQAEMNSPIDVTAQRLTRNPAYVRAFASAFDGTPDAEITPRSIRMALAAYIRSLVAVNSRVDSAMRGKMSVLAPDERLGFNLFTGKAMCATCHFIPLTNGTQPPAYLETDQEVIGVPYAAVWQKAHADDDVGRAAVTRAPIHRFAFKPPTLRNVALTAPYMHNGVYRTLEEVVRFYNLGGGAGIGISLPNQTLAPDKLNLTTAEQKALVRFMKALTDTSRH